VADVAKTSYDVIVVGSGASGGWAAKRLSEAGLKVALAEAGRPQSDKNFTEHMADFQLKYRDKAPEVIRRTRPIQKDCYACMEYNYDWFANDLDEPYTTPSGMPFSWQGQMRIVGGRTNLWGRQSYRLSDLDFKAASHDGYGEDWPLSYKDVAPYYDIVEEYVGITGMNEGVYELPDGKFHPPMGLTCAETLFRNRLKEKMGRVATLGRSANITRPITGRAPCHYCGPCERGCQTHSYFNSAFTTVADALNSGNCTLITNAMAYKVLMDSRANRAKGLLYIDRVNRQPAEVYGRVVVLCAQALESVRILLNSSNAQYPNGLANSSGALGHYLMDHITGGGAFGELPELGGKPSLNGPHRPDCIYVIRFRNTHAGPHSNKFLRGFGERLPRWENYVEIDPGRVDAFGIPVLRIHMTYGENERAILKDMAESAGEMLEAAGAKNVHLDQEMPAPGWAIHEVGIARMGSDAKKSVLNQFQQTHDIQNLFVMDGAGFTSTACQNPTLTIMALCVRSCDYLLGELKRRNI
jgi:choline dehydrogenase-like flavoprotein